MRVHVSISSVRTCVVSVNVSASQIASASTHDDQVKTRAITAAFWSDGGYSDAIDRHLARCPDVS